MGRNMGFDLVFRWQKSSFSGQSGDCVELGTAWHEGAAHVGAVRDSKNPAGPALRADLGALITFVKKA